MKHYDVAIVGAGIAGIWTAAALQAAGYRTVVFEAAAIGDGQTLASQGIIHGGTKYALTGKLTGSSEAVRAMPGRWKQHLAGELSPDLSSVIVNTPTQFMWDAGGVSSRVSSFFASKLMSSRVQRVADNELPAILKSRHVYQLQEPVLDVSSVLEKLSENLPVYQARVDSVSEEADGTSRLRLQSGEAQLDVLADMVVYAAGEGNERLQTSPMQRRPLHMVMVKGDLPMLWGHVIEANANPRMTITSHVLADGKEVVWYIGGQLAETGASLDTRALFALAHRELQTVFPGVDWSDKLWAPLLVNRAEGLQADVSRPASPVITQDTAGITIWPTKLVFAPMVADEILQRVDSSDLQPSMTSADTELSQTLDVPVARVGQYPWDQVEWSGLPTPRNG